MALLPVMSFGLSGCADTPAESVRLPVPAASVRCRVIYNRILNVSRTGRSPLIGWVATGAVIEKTLAQWYPRLVVRGGLTDPSPQDLSAALGDLPKPEDADISIVYLASTQTSDGRWRFRRPQTDMPLSDILKSASPPANRRRLVILDACHARSVLQFKEWRAFAPSAIFASSAGQRTYELNFRNRFRLDLPRRYPLAAAWLKANMPDDWDGRISFLGLIWLEAFLETDRAPETPDDWRRFIDLCTEKAQKFRARHSRKLASTVSGYAGGTGL